MKYFTIDEMTRSATAVVRGIDNTPPPEAVINLNALIDDVLDKIRERWGRPVYINSGYRSEALNRAVGGTKTSQHRFGEAADITTGSPGGNAELFTLIQRMRADGEIDFDQLIDEKSFAWVHISYKRAGTNRGDVFKIA